MINIYFAYFLVLSIFIYSNFYIIHCFLFNEDIIDVTEFCIGALVFVVGVTNFILDNNCSIFITMNEVLHSLTITHH
jgi:hypothetical protein